MLMCRLPEACPGPRGEGGSEHAPRGAPGEAPRNLWWRPPHLGAPSQAADGEAEEDDEDELGDDADDDDGDAEDDADDGGAS